MRKRKIIWITIIGLLMILSACEKITTDDSEKNCKAYNECTSGVCKFYKKDSGKCAEVNCKTGEKADNNNFYCDEKGKWQKSRQTGERCANEYECFKQTCFMIPDCAMTDIPRTKVSCRENTCVQEFIKDECEEKGMKRILRKDQFKIYDGDCMESMAQIILPTICAPCGNGVCDEVESECNCQEDCD